VGNRILKIEKARGCKPCETEQFVACGAATGKKGQCNGPAGINLAQNKKGVGGYDLLVANELDNFVVQYSQSGKLINAVQINETGTFQGTHNVQDPAAGFLFNILSVQSDSEHGEDEARVAYVDDTLNTVFFFDEFTEA
jgi:hypothetical protein